MEESIPEECLVEMKSRDREKVTVSMCAPSEPGEVIKCEDHSDLKKLLRVTAYVLKFAKALKKTLERTPQQEPSPDNANLMLSAEEVEAARIYWLRAVQASLLPRFSLWKKQFDLFQDEQGLWRCRGRLGNSEIADTAKHPILLSKTHHLTHLIVWDCHKRVGHCGVPATLTELRTHYWVVAGRQMIRKLLSGCVICRRFQAKPYCPPPSPPLPSFRVVESPPFSHTGLDFAGPLYVRDTVASSSRKVWICLFTCCVTRAVHVDIVPDMTAQTFIRCFKRFTSRRGFPVKIVSDNAKTFKSAKRMIAEALDSAELKCHLSNVKVKWTFNLEKVGWPV